MQVAASPSAQSPSPPLPADSHQSPPKKLKRRGRPRSPVFTYFRRLVDHNGLFLGNQCSFCSFVSRDRSENPTYLTRHIIRTCDAPQHIKDALAARFANSHTVVHAVDAAPAAAASPQQQTTVVVSSHSLTLPDDAAKAQPLSFDSSQLNHPLPAAASASVAHALPTPHHQQLRPLGITKSRRGRPKSPALLHFRRHIDDKGLFIANQCIHCSFVSRDRSENSTLLLKHLLSPSCSAPDQVRQMLLASKASSKSLRKRAVPLAVAPDYLAHATASSAGDAQHNRQALVLSVLRFLLANDLPLATADNPLFQHLMLTATGPAALSQAGTANAAAHADNALSSITSQQLECFLSNHSATELVDVFNDKPPSPHSSAQLIIYFTDASQEAACCNQARARGKEDVLFSEESAAYVASVFRFVSASHLSYLFSRNCRLNFSSSVADIVQHAQQQCDIKCAQVLISRPLVPDGKPRAIPNMRDNLPWVPDVVREVDILCQELLAQVPLLIRVLRRNVILAAYFKEDYSKTVADEVFRRDDEARKVLHRYLQFIVKPTLGIASLHVFEAVSHTFDLVCQAQNSHKDAKRLVDTRAFFTTLTEENCGNVPLSQEIIRLLLSSSYRTDLKAFLSVMKPLITLISMFNITRNMPILRYSNPFFDTADLFRCPLEFRSRSLAHVLLDCARTMRELYSEKLPEHEDDLRLLREHVACRLLGQGVDGCPPVADDITYIAALLDPNSDLPNTKGITVDEVWKRAVQYVQSRHSGGETGVKTVLDQLDAFHNRKGQFADDSLFSKCSEDMDPLEWWEKCGHVTPELQSLALATLSVPTTAFAAVRHITNLNASNEDLQRSVGDEEMEKRRFITWNLRLAVSRSKADVSEEVAEGNRLKTESVLL